MKIKTTKVNEESMQRPINKKKFLAIAENDNKRSDILKQGIKAAMDIKSRISQIGLEFENEKDAKAKKGNDYTHNFASKVE
jgi:hypothetical protein